MRKTAAPALVALLLMTGASGCGGDPADDPGVTGASEPPASSAPTTEPTETGTAAPDESDPPFPGDTQPDDGGYGSGNGLGLVGVRTMGHPGYDRIVFDLGGTGTPGWYAQYVDRPLAEGSGEPVALQGTVYLQVVLRGLGLPYDTGLEPFGDATTRVPGDGTEGVAEIAPGGVFEGEQQAFIGLTGAERPFRVFALADPTRVVVDVAHD